MSLSQQSRIASYVVPNEEQKWIAWHSFCCGTSTPGVDLVPKRCLPVLPTAINRPRNLHFVVSYFSSHLIATIHVGCSKFFETTFIILVVASRIIPAPSDCNPWCISVFEALSPPSLSFLRSIHVFGK